MAVNWDFIVSGVILIWLGLVVAAKITNQTLPELFTGMSDFIAGRKDDALERGEELLYYD